MTFLQRLARAVMAASLTLLTLAATLGGLSAVIAALAEAPVLGVGGSFSIVFAYTLLIGAVPALCLGAPSYAWLWHKGHASWATAALLGAALGSPFLFVAVELGVWSAVAGVVVASATHAICRAGANNSFKPRPLRGSA
jgi:hypothetical protein